MLTNVFLLLKMLTGMKIIIMQQFGVRLPGNLSKMEIKVPIQSKFSTISQLLLVDWVS